MDDLTTPTATVPSRSEGSWVGYGAALWALVFAVLHIMWAMGWYVGLQQESARKAFQQLWFLVYDLVVAGLCVLAVAVALALVQSWGRRLPRTLLGVLAWGGAGLLALRGGAGVVQSVYFKAVGSDVSVMLALWDAWFCLGAILFGVSIWRFWRAPGRRRLSRKGGTITKAPLFFIAPFSG